MGVSGGRNKTHLATRRRAPLRRPHRAADRTIMGRVHFYPGTTFANSSARQDNDSAGFSAMTFREFEVRHWAGKSPGGTIRRYTARFYGRRLRYGTNTEPSTPLRMPKDRMAFWASFLPDAYRKLRPDGIWIHDLPYWSNALSAEVGRHTGDLLIKYDPRDVSRIFVQHPVSGHFIEARARNLGFPAISLREWRLARKRRDRRAGESVTTTS